MNLVQLLINGISYSQTQNGAYALILSEIEGERKLPIVIGTNEAQSIAIAIEKEIKKRNGAFKKQTDDVITARFKNAKSDKDFDDAVIKISKRVLKALHDMHYKRTNLIDKMPVPKN